MDTTGTVLDIIVATVASLTAGAWIVRMLCPYDRAGRPRYRLED